MTTASIVGAGPNGLAAAVTLARAGVEVDLYESSDTVGGGARTEEVTLPGFRHDIGAAVHPMALASEFFRRFQIVDRVEFLNPDVAYAHPLRGSDAAIAYRDIRRTAVELGADERAWMSLFSPLIQNIDAIADFSGGSMLGLPRRPLKLIPFLSRVLEQASPAWNLRFSTQRAAALLTGVQAHAVGRLPGLPSSGVGLVLAAHGHARGWPIPRGGTVAISNALRSDLEKHGGRVHTGVTVSRLADLPTTDLTLLDVSARALAAIAGDELPPSYVRALRRFAYGSGVAKVDFALSEPVPWKNIGARQAVTLHLGGTRAEIAAAERDVARGRHAERPYVLFSQPTVVDSSRAPEGRHVGWAYIHVPSGSGLDPTSVITEQIERWAPGFRDTILMSRAMSAVDLQTWNPNFIGGDISAGALTPWQLVARPTLTTTPWRTPLRGVYLASSSTPPGTGVHGMAGYHAARAALKDLLGYSEAPDLSFDQGKVNRVAPDIAQG